MLFLLLMISFENEKYSRNNEQTYWLIYSYCFQIIFPESSVNDYKWLINSFGKIETINLSAEEEEQLIDLRNNIFYQSTVAQKRTNGFWLATRESYPMITSKGVKIILPFAPSWLCEYGFLALSEIRSKKESSWHWRRNESVLEVSGTSNQLDLLSKIGTAIALEKINP